MTWVVVDDGLILRARSLTSANVCKTRFSFLTGAEIQFPFTVNITDDKGEHLTKNTIWNNSLSLSQLIEKILPIS